MRSRSRRRDPCRLATTQDTNCRDNLPCHPERSEGSARVAAEIPRCAQDDSAHRMNRLIDDRTTRLFIALAAFFCVNAVLAEFIGVKIFALRSEEHTSELQSLMRISYAVFCLKKKKQNVLHTLLTTTIYTSYTNITFI